MRPGKSGLCPPHLQNMTAVHRMKAGRGFAQTETYLLQAPAGVGLPQLARGRGTRLVRLHAAAAVLFGRTGIVIAQEIWADLSAVVEANSPNARHARRHMSEISTELVLAFGVLAKVFVCCPR